MPLQDRLPSGFANVPAEISRPSQLGLQRSFSTISRRSLTWSPMTPRNGRVTAIFYKRYLSEHPDADLEKLKAERYLAGPAVLFKEPVWF